MEITIVALLASFGGGVFAAAIGTLPAFVFTGFAVIAGVAMAGAGGGDAMLTQVAFGPFLAPHISFGGGAAATAYAARRGLTPNGRDIGVALMGLNRPDVLLIGGLFGAVGYLCERGLAGLGWVPWTDTIAVTVVLSAIIARLVFGRTGLFGRVATGGGQFRTSDAARWLAWQEKPGQIAVIGVGAGVCSAYAAISLGAEGGGAVLGFGIAAASLIFLHSGSSLPVTHHIALPAALAALASGSIVVGAVFGVIGALVGEFYSRLFLIHGDTHIDPPAAAIGTTVLLLRLAEANGLMGG
jgi:hypothetical protein